ncbi:MULTISPECIES: GbsR/MarR family transcriptional regulator [Actinoalloteichus]|uniref:Transcriptional regulator n=1 Tax=Actinoalloteichus fjordicus TaxID=1612552 RepID=A0AAC9PRX9_9PSEU|nr:MULTISPECIES: helix-turn-helix domain-containing protein [Actinoalloteichus]APU14558.1 putative transcriptional regulator [Actinoalloteichus fjordicus]APU20526.1 putative transcriptional regulator [Actinoalloteichus sp. GBA129-24]
MTERGTYSTPAANWIERVAAFYVEEGMPLIAGRILGYLLICDPPERTAAELAAAVDASSGSVSTNIRLLARAGLVSKTTRRGREAALYRLEEHRWPGFVQDRFDRVARARDLTKEGLRLLSGNSQRAARLREVSEFYGWLTDQLPELWTRWEAERRTRR